VFAEEYVLTSNPGGELWSVSACELSRAYAARELSPVEVLAAIFTRIDTINPKINAIVSLNANEAWQAARASEKRWRAGAPLGALDGIPLTIKDSIPVKGLRTTWGSRLLEDYVPDRDELPVARLREQGVVILGKTNVPEFTLQGYTDNLLFGPTRNPWDLALTPGGSSGGAVAAVASGLGPVALGTDGGGSIRRPASHTGLVGLKPSLGRVAQSDGLPPLLHDFEVIGPIARTTADVELLFDALAGVDRRDQASLAFPGIKPELAGAEMPQRILFVPQVPGSPVDPEIAANVAEAARNLQALGHHVESAEAPFEGAALDRVWSVVGPSGLAWLLRRYPDWRSKVSRSIRTMAESGAALTAADYVDALAGVARLRSHFEDVFTRYDLILTPSAAALPWLAEVSHPEAIGGQPVGSRGHAVFTAFANAAGLPGISIPCRPSQAGLPIGIQLVGAFGADEKLLRLAHQYECASPWADRWPSFLHSRRS
jgi:aspartyl-tRNA(Asn)/glutamyl-tRNA(Gln) amidotransferase subunit A